MTMIGVRELRQQMAEVLRQIREENAEYIITYQGRPMAVMLPLNTEVVEQAILDAGKRGMVRGWEIYAQIAALVRERWPEAMTTQNLLDEIRR